MPHYEELYHNLFNGITDTIDGLTKTIEQLKALQIEAENKYIAFCEEIKK